jgi:hypothetical protein
LSEIPQIVTEFIQSYIGSVDALKVLLLLRDTPEKEWGPLAVSSALELDRAVAALRLEELKSGGLLLDRTVANERLYRYGPSSEMAVGDKRISQGVFDL